MGHVQFEENRFARPLPRVPKPPLLVQWNIAKTPRDATRILVIVLAVALVAAFFLFSSAFSEPDLGDAKSPTYSSSDEF